MGVVNLDGRKDMAAIAVPTIPIPTDFTLVLVVLNEKGQCFLFKNNFRFHVWEGPIHVNLTDFMTSPQYDASPRQCHRCKSSTPNGTPICIHCHYNWHCQWMFWVQMIPIIGVPFGIARTVLTVSRAAYDGKEPFLAAADLVFICVDIALLPFIIGEAVAGIRLATLLSREGATAGTGAADLAMGVANAFAQVSAPAATEAVSKETGKHVAKEVGQKILEETFKAAIHRGAEVADDTLEAHKHCVSLLRCKGNVARWAAEALMMEYPCHCCKKKKNQRDKKLDHSSGCMLSVRKQALPTFHLGLRHTLRVWTPW